MDIKNGKVFHKELPNLLKEKLKKMSYQERQELLEILEDPEKRAGVFIKEFRIFYQAS